MTECQIERRPWYLAQCDACLNRQPELIPAGTNVGRCTVPKPGQKVSDVIMLGPATTQAKCPMFHWIHEDCEQTPKTGKDEGI